MSALNNEEVEKLYRLRARHYDLSANLYYLAGFREWAYRKKGVEALKLKAGDTVVEIGCGTGLNFSMLQQKIGPTGKLIGVDLTDAMLAQACRRAEKHGWSNVELVQSDAVLFDFPQHVDAIVSTFALTLMPGFDKVIENGSNALSPGARWVIIDFKMPSNWLARLAPFFVFITKPFGVTMDLAQRHPWEAMDKYLGCTTMEELYGGLAYIACGEQVNVD